MIYTTLGLLLSLNINAGSEFCGIRNTCFGEGEQITLKVFYSLAGVNVDAGTARFTTSLANLNGKTVYHSVGEGWSNPSYDWIFKVRDRYESYYDTASLLPYQFIRNISEGGYTKHENVKFNHTAKSAVTTNKVLKTPDCVQDVISAVYYARNIDFDKYKKDDKIYLKMFMDDEIHDMYVRYIGKEVIKTRYGKFNAIKFKPLLLKGSMFEGGEKMTVWVSDDANRIPLRIESGIVVGSVKVDMMGYRNLRHPLSSLQSFR